ncbi:MATE family efflux transporter [Paraferrimonas sp. SM1919]|uniref:MATE family efflux transporter n=1 Tax=Paraferrimonas sp. SM1919 TaxID=2662263 RepID=UPI0013D33716|nr:MATE family efflux transporter [Paraferrimonas sp. SM1919]
MKQSRAFFNDSKMHYKVLALAFPMIVSNITTPLLGLVDTAVLGHLDQAHYLAGVAFGSMVLTLLFWLLGFLRMSTTGLVAQALGAKDNDKQLHILGQGLLLALVFALLIVALQDVWLGAAAYFSNPSALVLGAAKDYYGIRVYSAPFSLMNLVFLGWLLGRHHPKAAMYSVVLANLLNLGLDLYLVLVLKWGVKGAAWASLVAEIGSFMLLASFTLTTIRQQLSARWQQLWLNLQPKAMLQLMSLNRDIFIRSLCLQAAFSFMTFKAANIGELELAANAILLNFLMLTAYALDGFAYSAEAMVGKGVGAKDKHQVKQAVNYSLLWSLLASLGFSLVFLGFGEAILGAMTSITEVQQTALVYLPWLVWMPLLAVTCYLFDGVYIGAAKGQVMRDSMLVSSLGVFFPVWHWLNLDYGNHALWGALTLFMLARGITLAGHYYISMANDRFIR